MASPERPGGERLYASTSESGLPQPSPQPRTKEAASSAAKLVANGNPRHVAAARKSEADSTRSSLERRTSAGITVRTTRSATAKLPITTPMSDADNPIERP